MMNRNELQNKVNDLRELRRMADELEAEISAIQDSIKNYMTAAGVDEINGTDFKVTWKNVTSQRFDKTAMIQTFGQDCYNGFCKPVTIRRFCVA